MEQQEYGELIAFEEFCDDVKQGYIIDYDGSGYFHDGMNCTDIPVPCTYEALCAFRGLYFYVNWYAR